MTTDEQLLHLFAGPIEDARTIAANGLTNESYVTAAPPQAQGFAWVNNSGASAVLILSPTKGTRARGGIRLHMRPYTMATVPGCFGSVAIDKGAPVVAGTDGEIDWYWLGYRPGFDIRAVGATGIGSTGQGNTLAIPAGWPVLFDVTTFRNCTITVKSWGAPAGPLPLTVIRAENLVNATITVFGGDQLDLGDTVGGTIDTTDGSAAQAGQSALVRVGRMLGGNITVYGDQVDIGTLIAGAVINQAPAANAPNYIRIGRVVGQGAGLQWGGGSLLADCDTLMGTITINNGLSVVLTTGVVTDSPSITSNGSYRLGTGGTGSGDPRYTFDQLLVDNVATTVPAGASYASAAANTSGTRWIAAAVAQVSGTSLDYDLNITSYPPLIQARSGVQAPLLGQSANNGNSASQASTLAGSLTGAAELPTAAVVAYLFNANTTDSLSFSYLEVVGG